MTIRKLFAIYFVPQRIKHVAKISFPLVILFIYIVFAADIFIYTLIFTNKFQSIV